MQGRIFDFGNKQARNNAVDVNVASGIPCGMAARRGELESTTLILCRKLLSCSALIEYRIVLTGAKVS